MAEKGNVYQITKSALEQHVNKANEKLISINRGAGVFANFVELSKKIEGDDVVIAQEVQDTISVLRKGACLYYEMYATLEDRIRKENIDGKIDQKKKFDFLGAYSMFAASSYISQKLTDLLKDEEPGEIALKDHFRFDFVKDDVLNYVLSRYYGIIEVGKMKKEIEKGIDLPKASVNFFKKIRDDAIAKKSSFPKELVDIIKDSSFKVADEFDIQGFQVSDMEALKMPKIEFVKVYPNEVVGNEVAKRKIVRYMDRLALYDPKAKNNPCITLGGLSWTNLWDGIPGTGKTTMMRMAMTRLAELCDIIGMKYKIHAIDQSVKSEFYGKTGQNAIAEFNSTKDPNFLHITLMDDLDLLTQGTRQETSGGADNDLRNVIMQFLDGAFTLRIGNNQVYAASNDPKGLDPAVRNRFSDRILVEGPKTVEDLADMTYILTKQLREGNLLNVSEGYTPLVTQDNYVNGRWTRPDEAVYQIDPKFVKEFKNATIMDFGKYLFELKKKNPSISGRSVKAIIEAVKERSANFDVPTEFYTNRSVYFDQPFDKKISILRELYKKIEPEVFFQEAERYAQSEARYTKGEEDREVERGYNARIWNMKSEIKAMKSYPELYGQVTLLRTNLALSEQQKKDIIERVKKGGKE